MARAAFFATVSPTNTRGVSTNTSPTFTIVRVVSSKDERTYRQQGLATPGLARGEASPCGTSSVRAGRVLFANPPAAAFRAPLTLPSPPPGARELQRPAEPDP